MESATFPPVDNQELRDALLRAAQLSLQTIERDLQRTSPKIVPMLLHMQRHLFDPELNVQSLKKACGIRDNSIAIRFHQELNRAPKAYLTQRRMETAARLLVETRLHVWQIADAVGYSSLGVFSKAFNRWAGLRPTHYRRQMGEPSDQGPTLAWLQPDFFDRAMAGKLARDEATWLLRQLLALYPAPPPS